MKTHVMDGDVHTMHGHFQGLYISQISSRFQFQANE